MTTPEAALAAATLAMSVVKNEANDNYGTWTWTVEQGAARFLEVMRNKGYALTPLAPEVPPRRDGLRDVVTATGEHRVMEVPTHPCPDCGDVHADLDYVSRADVRLAATRTPEPPDSGDGAALRLYVLTRLIQIAHDEMPERLNNLTRVNVNQAWAYANPHGGYSSGLTRELEAEYARLRSGSPAPEGGE